MSTHELSSKKVGQTTNLPRAVGGVHELGSQEVSDVNSHKTVSNINENQIASTVNKLVESIVGDLDPNRLVASDAAAGLVSVAHLTDWIAGVDNQIGVADDGDGSVTLGLSTTVVSQLHSPVTVLDSDSINLSLSGQQVSAAVKPGGISHAAITDLDYASAGHTGFEPTVTKGNLTTGAPLSFDQTRQVIGGAAVLSIAQASGAQDGYLSSGDWNTFNGKLDNVSGENHSTLSNLSYASAGHTGFEPTVSKGNLTEVTSSILTVTGGTGVVIGAGTTIQVLQSSGSQDGYLSSEDWSTFNGKLDNVSGEDHSTLNNLDYASAGHTGFEPTLAKGNIIESGSSVLTITGGAGAVLGSGTTVEVALAGASQSGYLSTVDWNTFNDKQDAITPGVDYEVPLTFASPLYRDSSDEIGILQADASVDGYLSAADWNIFDSKQPALTGSVKGTANQVNVSANSNSVAQNITLSLPQNLHTEAEIILNAVAVRGNISPVANAITLDVGGLYGAMSYSITSGLGLTIRGMQGVTLTADTYGVIANIGASNLSTRYDASNRLDTSVSSVGIATFTPTGASAQVYLAGATRIQSLSGILKGLSGVISAAAAGTDYQYGLLTSTRVPFAAGSPATLTDSADLTWDGDELSVKSLKSAFYVKAASMEIGSLSGILVGSTGVVSAITDNSTNWDLAVAHISESGASHSYIDQAVTVAGTPTFASVTAEQLTSTDDITMAGKFLNTMAALDTEGLIVDGATNPYDYASSVALKFSNMTRTIDGDGAIIIHDTGIYGWLRGLTWDYNFTGNNANFNAKLIAAGGDSLAFSGDLIFDAGFGAKSGTRIISNFSTTSFTGAYTSDKSVNSRWIGGWFNAYNAGTFNITANVTSLDFVGGYFTTENSNPTDLAGGVTPIFNYYGGYFRGVGTDVGVSIVYAGYFTGTGGDVNYGVYSAAGSNVFVEGARLGGDTNYLAISDAGVSTMHGNARVYRHLDFGPKRFKLPATNFPSEGEEGLFSTLDFDKGTDESARCEDHIPYRWDDTTDIQVEIDWLHDGVDAGTVCWAIEYKSIKAGEAVAGAGVTISKVSAGNHTAGQLVRTIFTLKVLASNLEADDVIGVRLFRDTSEDTLNEDARFVEAHFHFVMDKLGQSVAA